ncbi:Maf family nucleotide pyrophosphatase [Pseudochryseolinea flava]|uniref:dTTP/UTP pyrophosphatase n=1 Tax=Pseudochryseolinea flava TaxID=2059302 RepID=A0A364XUN8_9BACT|nr:Maf family nucleotide pyrophosphatase [Pseudochryseolinea flava]RAV97838.1 septum formation protein Maf [Pseudochryseolinea flava]
MIPSNRPLILASSSPRRQYLMKEAGFTFTVEKPDVEEDFPDTLPVDQVAKFLAAKKAEYFRPKIQNEIIVTADTVVVLGKTILNKPFDRSEAIKMLSSLSGKTHLVITGVCIVSKEKEESFDDTTEVTFKTLTQAEIEFYVDNYKPYDKAGAYGAQDWIGMVAIEKITGSYFNVMGLPIHRVHQHLVSW